MDAKGFELLMAAKTLGKGGGGTSDYTDLENKPSINGVELSGNKTAAQLNVAGLDESGKVPMNLLPPAAIEREVPVQDDTARFALTTDDVQLGDTVKVVATNKMYLVVDTEHLDTEAGYSVYVAGRAAEAVADEDGNNIKNTYFKTANIDSALSTTSENPVQNKVLAAILNHFTFSENSKQYYLQPEQPSNPQDGDIWIG